jgi:hypothetical protein
VSQNASHMTAGLKLPETRYCLIIRNWNKASIRAIPKLVGRARANAVVMRPLVNVQAFRIDMYPSQFSMPEIIVARLHITVVVAMNKE